MRIFPITETSKALYEAEIEAIEKELLEIKKVISEEKLAEEKLENLTANERLIRERHIQLTHQQQDLKLELQLYDESLKKTTQATIQKGVNVGVGTVWTSILTTGINLKTGIDAAVYAGRAVANGLVVASKILGAVLFPVHFAIESVRSVWELYRLGRERMIGRDTHINATIVNFGAIGMAIMVTAFGITNPFVLPIIFMAVMGAGIYKTISVSRQLTAAMKEESKVIRDLDKQIKDLKDTQDPLNQAKLNTLTKQKERHENQLAQLTEQRFQARRELVFTAISTAAVIMLIVGVLVPPVAFAGLFLFASAAIVNVVDANTNFRASRAIARAYNKVADGLSSIKRGISNLFASIKNKLSRSKSSSPDKDVASKKEQDFSPLSERSGQVSEHEPSINSSTVRTYLTVGLPGSSQSHQQQLSQPLLSDEERQSSFCSPLLEEKKEGKAVPSAPTNTVSTNTRKRSSSV